MNNEEIIDKEIFDKSISYFEKIINCNTSNWVPHKMGATFIGIKTNISGELKFHIYIILFPFFKFQGVVPYPDKFPNLYFKDICFNVDEKMYLWIYEEMKKQESIILLNLEKNILKVVEGGIDPLIILDKNCKENKDWMNHDFKDWFHKGLFLNEFLIQIINPFLYMVPIPTKNIYLKTDKKNNHLCSIII